MLLEICFLGEVGQLVHIVHSPIPQWYSYLPCLELILHLRRDFANHLEGLSYLDNQRAAVFDCIRNAHRAVTEAASSIPHFS
jgi:hypothetical protein